MAETPVQILPKILKISEILYKIENSGPLNAKMGQIHTCQKWPQKRPS